MNHAPSLILVSGSAEPTGFLSPQLRLLRDEISNGEYHMSNYDPAFVEVTIDQEAYTRLFEHADAARYLFDRVEAGVRALDQEADAKAMASYFRAVLSKASQIARDLP